MPRSAARRGAKDGWWWVLEVDIRKFFDTIPRQRLLEVLRQRVRDGVILRLIAKWLHAGVAEEGLTTHPDTGTPQGGVVSPILARAQRAIWDWLKANRHLPFGDQQVGLIRRLTGHYNYYALRGNLLSVWKFYDAAIRAWKRWLSRRSDKAGMTWSRFNRIRVRFPLPMPSIRVRSERAA